MENLDKLVNELRKLPTETQWLEFKHNNYTPDMIGRDISALANSASLYEKSCAYMLWGIDDETHEIVGTDYDLQTLKKGNQECYVKAGEMVVVRSQRLVVLDTDNENEEWGSFFKHIRFKDESLANILKVMNLNSDSLQIQVVSPALEERRLTVEFSDESSEVIANLIANALGLQCIRQGDILLLSE